MTGAASELTPQGRQALNQKYYTSVTRRRHLKLLYRQRFAHKIDAAIQQTELKLELLKEIRDASHQREE